MQALDFVPRAAYGAIIEGARGVRARLYNPHFLTVQNSSARFTVVSNARQAGSAFHSGACACARQEGASHQQAADGCGSSDAPHHERIQQERRRC